MNARCLSWSLSVLVLELWSLSEPEVQEIGRELATEPHLSHLSKCWDYRPTQSTCLSLRWVLSIQIQVLMLEILLCDDLSVLLPQKFHYKNYISLR